MDIIFFTGAVIAGFASSYYLVVIRFNQFVTVVYHLPYRIWRRYTSLYDALENKDSYRLLGGEGRFENHRSFLNEYDTLRPQIEDHFRGLWNAYAIKIGRDYGLVLALSLVLFWGIYWVFIISFLTIQLAAFFNLYYRKKYRLHFFATLFLSLLLSKQA